MASPLSRMAGGVQVPPPTRRKPLFDSGFRRVCGRVEKVLKEFERGSL